MKKPKIEKFEISEPVFSGHESIFGRLERSLNPRDERVVHVPTYSEKCISTHDLEETPELELRRLTSSEKLNPDETRKNLLSSKLSAEKKYASNYTGESLNVKKRRFYEKLNTVINSPQKKPYGTLKPVLGNEGRNVAGDNKIVVRGEDGLEKRTEKNVLDLGYAPVRGSGRIDLSQTTRFELPGANKEVIVGDLGKNENLTGKVDGSKTPLFGENSGIKGGFGQFSELQQDEKLGKRMGNNEGDAPKPNFGFKGEKEGLFVASQENSLFTAGNNKGGFFGSGASSGFNQSSTGLFSQGTLNNSSLFNKTETGASDLFKPETKKNEPARQTLFNQTETSNPSINSSETQKSLFSPSQGSLFGGSKLGEFKNEEKKIESKPEENKGQNSLFGNFSGNVLGKSDKEPGAGTSGLFGNNGGNPPGGLFTGNPVGKEAEKNNASLQNNSLFGGAGAGENKTVSVFGLNTAGNTVTNAFIPNNIENNEKSGLFGTNTGENKSGILFGSSTTAKITGSLFGSTSAPDTTGRLFGSTSVPDTTGSLFGSTTAANTTGNVFGPNAAEIKTGSSFGSSAAVNTIGGSFGAGGTSGSLFGASTSENKTGSLFGSNSTEIKTSGLFGSFAAGNTIGNNKEGASNSNLGGLLSTNLGGNTASPLFGGNNASPFGANSTSNVFGNNSSNNAGGLFGGVNKNNSPAGAAADKSNEKNETKPFGLGYPVQSFQSSNPTSFLQASK